MAEETTEAEISTVQAPEGGSGGAGRAEKSAIDSFKAAEAAMAAEEKAPVEEKQEPATEGAEENAESVETEADKEAATETAADGKTAVKTEEKKVAKTGNKKSAKERINELTKERSEVERERDELKARIEALEKGEKAPTKDQKTTRSAQDSGDEEPDPEKFEYGTLDPAYHKAVRQFDKDQLRKEMDLSRQAEAASAKAAELQAKHDAQVEELDSEVGDFVEVVVQGAQDGKWACTPDMNAHIKASDTGAKIAYHLAKNPAESLKVSKMDPIEQAKWFGRKEAELSAATPSPKGKSKEAAVSKADPPANVVKGANGKFQANPGTTDFAAFEKAHAHLLNQ